jgi:hypothetical protein
MRHLRLAVLATGATILIGCSANSAKPAPEASAYLRLQALPPADPAKFANVHDYKSWRNPYLMVRKDGVALLDFSNNEERLLKFEELPDALARLSVSAWPYGRVVAVIEDRAKVPDDQALIRKNRGIVAGTLESMHILINWVPSV